MTAADLLADCHAKNIILRAHGGRLDIDAPGDALTPDLLERLRDAKPELLAMLDAGDQHDLAATTAPRPRSAIPVPGEWPGAAADFVLLLAPDDLPPVPFRLNAWTTVFDAGRFLQALRGDIAAGPSGPRSFYGAAQADLVDLRRFAIAASDDRQRDSGREAR